jgi:hypothetical protein
MGCDIGRVIPSKVEPPRPKLNVTQIMHDWAVDTDPDWVRNLAFDLGVTFESLVALGATWCHEKNAWAFPMYDGWGEPIGIRLRASDGKKFAYPGSRNGLFIPNTKPQSVVWITEGPTSCSAALSLGLFSISRPSCSGSLDQIPIACKRLGVQRAVIIADNDLDKQRPDGTTWNPGVDSTQKLSELMKIPSCTFVPCAKDLRDFLKLGGTRELIEATIRNLIWRQPK